MREIILQNLDNPGQLEKLYRSDRPKFKASFNALYPEIKENPLSKAWFERLNFESEEISWGSRSEWIFVVIVSLLAGLIAKVPDLTNITPDFYYPRNIGFIVFPSLMAFFAYRNQLSSKTIVGLISILSIAVVYINILPQDNNSDTFALACIHLALFLWSLAGFTFVGKDQLRKDLRLGFLRYNGDLIVMCTVLLIALGILSAITLGLFDLIGIRIEEYYFRYVAVWFVAAVPVVGTHLVQANPQMVNKISPVIARIFTPLVIITLLVYISAVFFTGKDPYNDRDFLMIFNLLLIGVMALILFSLSDISKRNGKQITVWLLLILSLLTVCVNAIASSAVLYRLLQWGITPNRIAVLGGNLLIMTNLLFIVYHLIKSLGDRSQMGRAENSIAVFMPIYVLWAAFVTFLFPLIFGFR